MKKTCVKKVIKSKKSFKVKTSLKAGSAVPVVIDFSAEAEADMG